MSTSLGVVTVLYLGIYSYFISFCCQWGIVLGEIIQTDFVRLFAYKGASSATLLWRGTFVAMVRSWLHLQPHLTSKGDIFMKKVAFSLVASALLAMMVSPAAWAVSCQQRAANCVSKGGSQAGCQAPVASCERTGQYVAPSGKVWSASKRK
jgi:hypothetical protein